MAARSALPAPTGITRLAHPEAGSLRLAFETLTLSADDYQQLIVHLPADSATTEAPDGLAVRHHGGLRAVSG